MDRSQAEAIVQKTLALSTAAETEVILSHGEENLTRFSNNAISQNVARNTDSLTIKVHLGKKVGRTTTDRFDDESLRGALQNACNVAEQQTENPELLPLLGQSDFPLVDYFNQETAAYSPQKRALTIKSIVDIAKQEKAELAGIFSTGSEAVALGNSAGLFAYYRSTTATLSATAEIAGQSGWADDNSRDVTKIDAERVVATALEKASLAQNPEPIDPGDYCVVLEPAAVSDFLMFMVWEGFGGLNFNEGRSFMTGKLGEKILGDNVTIIDDAFSASNPGLPFDFEGVPRQKITLIENGIARAAVHDRYTALKAGVASTGHSLPQPNSAGPLALNVSIEPGQSSLQEMISSTEKGLLVTHFHYTNVLDPVTLTLTGMTRDGTFLIENGKVTRPVRNLRFTDNIVEAFNHVEAISRDRKTVEAFFEGSFVAPAMKLSKFHFSSVSEF
ncbi:TldD/PmbA family protein [bacterium]|nr:TldD/PmbA family protein [bacterium]